MGCSRDESSMDSATKAVSQSTPYSPGHSNQGHHTGNQATKGLARRHVDSGGKHTSKRLLRGSICVRLVKGID